MSKSVFYNEIAGRNLGRLSGLSDGVFAFAMTLLVLDIRVPPLASIHSEAALWHALVVLSPRMLTWAMSFMTLGIFWVGQQTHHHYLSHSDRAYTWLNIAFLMAISLVPFSTALLAEFIEFRLALVIYWLNILAIGILFGAMWFRANAFGLLKSDTPPEVKHAILRRIVVGQALYAFGAALCVFSTYWSIGFIVAVQLQYAIAPRFKPFTWL